MSKIFLSYSGMDEEFVNVIDDYSKNLGVLLIRDQRDLKIGGDIEKFARKIRKPNKSIIVVSQSFLESENCMFEVTEAFRDFYEDEGSNIRIIVANYPGRSVMLGEARNEKKYVEFWNKKSKDQVALIKKIEPTNATELTAQARRNEKIAVIKNNIPKFLSFIRIKKYITNDAITLEGITLFAQLLKELDSRVEVPQMNSQFKFTFKR